jgi:hypothetical protein
LTVRAVRGLGGIRRVWGQLGRDGEAGLRRLPFFTQRTAVLLLGVLVATRERRSGMPDAPAEGLPKLQGRQMRRRYPTGVLTLLGGVVTLVGWPGANGPTRLVPGEQAGRAPVSARGPATRPLPGARTPEAGDRSGADAGGAAAAGPQRTAPTPPPPGARRRPADHLAADHHPVGPPRPGRRPPRPDGLHPAAVAGARPCSRSRHPARAHRGAARARDGASHPGRGRLLA